MKKLNHLIILNFAACLFGLVVFLVCIQFVACKKETAHIDNRGELIEADFEEPDEDEYSVDVEDILDEDAYVSDASLKIDSITGVKAINENDLVCIEPYKYTGYFPVGAGAQKTTLTFHLNKADSVLYSVYTNRDTSVTVSNLVRIDSTHYSVDVATITNNFKAKSVSFGFKRKVNGVDKIVKKSAKMVHRNAEGKLYGKALYGLQSTGFNPSSPNAIQIDTNYIPQLGDIVQLEDTLRSQPQWCAVLTNPTITPAKTVSGAYVPPAYRFRVIQFNSNCKGGTTKRYVKAYKKDMATRIQNKEKTARAVAYYR